MTGEHQNAIKIAIVETELKGLREQQKAHADEMREGMKEIRGDVAELMAIMNKGRGAFAASVAVAAAIGGFVVLLCKALIAFFR